MCMCVEHLNYPLKIRLTIKISIEVKMNPKE